MSYVDLPAVGVKCATDLVGDEHVQRVNVANLPATQPVSAAALPLPLGASTEATAAALLTAAQAIQAAAETLAGRTLNTSAVGGTVALDAPTLAALESISASVSGTVAVANLPETQPVSGTVAVSNFPEATALTDAQLRATPLSIANASAYAEDTPHTTGAIGNLMLAIRSDGDTPTADNGDYSVLKLDEAGRLKVSTMPASYAATVGNITANAQTVAVDCTRFSNLMIHCAGTFAGANCTFEGSLNSTNGADGNWFAVQAIRSNANTIDLVTGVLGAAPAYAWELSVNALKYFRVRATAFTSGTQIWTMIPGTYATEPIPAAQVSATQPVSGTLTSAGTTTNTPATPTANNLNSAATTNATVVKATAGTLYNIAASNTGAAAAFIKLYNKATAPTVGTDVPVLTLVVPASGNVDFDLGPMGHRFATGIGLAITNLAPDTDTTAVAAAQVKVLTSYI